MKMALEVMCIGFMLPLIRTDPQFIWIYGLKLRNLRLSIRIDNADDCFNSLPPFQDSGASSKFKPGFSCRCTGYR